MSTTAIESNRPLQVATWSTLGGLGAALALRTAVRRAPAPTEAPERKAA